MTQSPAALDASNAALDLTPFQTCRGAAVFRVVLKGQSFGRAVKTRKRAGLSPLRDAHFSGFDASSGFPDRFSEVGRPCCVFSQLRVPVMAPGVENFNGNSPRTKRPRLPTWNDAFPTRGRPFLDLRTQSSAEDVHRSESERGAFGAFSFGKGAFGGLMALQ